MAKKTTKTANKKIVYDFTEVYNQFAEEQVKDRAEAATLAIELAIAEQNKPKLSLWKRFLNWFKK